MGGCHNPDWAGKVLRVGLQDGVRSLDPAIGYDVPSWAVAHLLYNTLVTYDRLGQVVGDLATHWRVDATGLVYDFVLPPGLTFHDGRPCRARDVVYSFQRLFDPATRSPGAAFYTDILGASERLAGQVTTPLGIVAIQPDQLRITLKRANPIFLQLLAMPFVSVVPEGVAGAQLARRPIGTGPFRFEKWVVGQRVIVRRRARQHERAAYFLDGVSFELGLNESLEVLKFEKGELDLIGALRGVSSADFVRLKDDARFGKRMVTGTHAAFHYVTINCEVAPFDRPLVRQAVAQAIDKRKLIRLINGRGVVAQGILPPTLPGFDPSLRGWAYSPAAAREALAKAGLSQGFDTTYYCTTNDTQRRIAQAISQDLAAIGIRVRIKSLALPTYLEAKSTRGRVPIGSGNWSADYLDPSNFLSTMFHSRNIRSMGSLNDSFYRNQAVDDWLNRGERNAGFDERMRSFRAAERLIVRDAAVVPLYFPLTAQFHAPWVRNHQLHPVWGLMVEDLDMEQR
jgi:ABC-type transport system substrate-binding protein